MTETRTSLLRIPEGAVLNDRYEITGFLGKGGFAAVYEGFDTVIERRVAVKVLTVQANVLEEKAYLEKLERFRREAKASARIKHPNVVTVFDMGVIEDSRQPYIVMEILEGRSLSEEIKLVGRFDPKRALKLFGPALDALGAAHHIVEDFVALEGALTQIWEVQP